VPTTRGVVGVDGVDELGGSVLDLEFGRVTAGFVFCKETVSVREVCE
jgi:hypothetical protein